MSHTYLTDEDLRFVVTRLPRDIRALVSETSIVIGGGFIRETIAGNQPKDIDVFGQNGDVLTLAAKLLCEKRSDARSFTTKNAITVLSPNRMPVQFITRWLFQAPADVVASFDFTVCQAAIWYDRAISKWVSVCGAGFYPDLAARRLVYTFPVREEDAGGSILRVRKFLQRGYSIQANSFAGVISRIAMSVRLGELETKYPNPQTREKEIAKVVSGLLREVDPSITIEGMEPLDEHESLLDEVKP